MLFWLKFCVFDILLACFFCSIKHINDRIYESAIMQQDNQLQYYRVDDCDIAVNQRLGKSQPGLFWLSGYRSDMLGSKAVVIDDYAKSHELSCVRFDYSGHGVSKGDFFAGSISHWLNQSLAVFEHFTKGPQILIGSSMGGWIALRMAQELQKRQHKLAGLLLIAPAPDFTKDLIEPSLTESQKQALLDKGYFEVASEYSDHKTPFTKQLLNDGHNNLVLNGMIDVGCPVAILQGMVDQDVPYQHTLKLMEHLPVDDVTLTLIRDGDHRLSRPEDLAQMTKTLDLLINQK